MPHPNGNNLPFPVVNSQLNVDRAQLGALAAHTQAQVLRNAQNIQPHEENLNNNTAPPSLKFGKK